MATNTSRYIPPQDQGQLILAWLRRARESQLAHYAMADKMSRKASQLGIPVIILTALIGTSALASVAAEIIPNWSKIILGLLSIAAAVLSSLQTFFGYADRAEKHRSSAAAFGSVRRDFESLYARRNGCIEEGLIDGLSGKLDALAKEALYVPEKVFAKIQKNPLFVDVESSNH